jgi:hypothetical protein
VIGLSRNDVRLELQERLEQAVRERLATEIDKAVSAKTFNDALKQIDERIKNIVDELDGCVQQRLPLGEPEKENG